MKKLFLPIILLLGYLLSACSTDDHDHDHEHEDAHGHEEAAADYERGPNGGRLLREGDFALEVTIYEAGVPPRFQLYGYLGEEPLPPGQVQVSVQLARLGGKVDRFQFQPEGNALVGDGTVVEPHSFDVTVTASHDGRQYRWEYASHEGRTMLPTAVAEAAGVAVAPAGPAVIRDLTRLIGRIALNGDRQAVVKARFPGQVLAVKVATGERVRRGQVLATVENRESLRSYDVLAPLDGIVLARHTNVGDVAGDAALFEIADLSQLWLELHAFGAEAARLQAGMPVRVSGAGMEAPLETRLSALLPMANAASQTVVARAVLPNQEGRWRPGMSVSAEITLGETAVPLAVRTSGLQRFRDFTVVFARFGETYEVRMLELGRQDGEWAEVLGGIDPGTPYVVEQSFLIKADIEKSGASHDH